MRSAYEGDLRRVLDLLDELIDPDNMTSLEAKDFLAEVQEGIDVRLEGIESDIQNDR